MRTITRNIKVPDPDDKDREEPFTYTEFETLGEAVDVLDLATVLEYINWRHVFIQQVEFRSSIKRGGG